MNVVITGMGAVSALGVGVEENWARLLAGDDAFGPVTHFATEGYRCQRAGQAPPLAGFGRRVPGASRILLTAAREACAQAGLRPFDGLPLSLSTTAGGMALGEEFLRALVCEHRARFATIARYHPGQQLLDLQADLGFRAGSTFLVANSCASGANAIGHARDLIVSGRADVVLAGGFEGLTELVFAGFDCLQAQTVEECRPFDVNRSGLLLGEAAACVIVESAAHAAARGAPALAVLAGYGHTTDTHHLTQPAPDGNALVRALRAACVQAGVEPAAIAAVNAHGTATPANDPPEQRAYEAVFGPSLPQIRSTKGATGHTLGAAGALEAVFAIQTLRTGLLPPQRGLRTPLPGMEAALTGRLEGVPAAVASANLGFGGSNAALVFAAEG